MIIMSVGEDYQNYIGKIKVVSFKINLEVLDFAGFPASTRIP